MLGTERVADRGDASNDAAGKGGSGTAAASSGGDIILHLIETIAKLLLLAAQYPSSRSDAW
jgi:hypothetical protein